jgi:hypothetical protein
MKSNDQTSIGALCSVQVDNGYGSAGGGIHHEKLMNQYNVEGYPTIKLLKDGQIIEYDAKPSKDTLTQFLNTVL